MERAVKHRFVYLLAGLLSIIATPTWAQTPPSGVVRYYHTDAVGSVRAVTDASGQVVAEHDYLPFGGEPAGAADSSPVRFSGKERDRETGLDYFGARYYASGLGRFTTVDPGHVGADAGDPQTWNGYTADLNNPIRFVDLFGTCSQDKSGNYFDRDDAGTLIASGPCVTDSGGALTAGITTSVTVTGNSFAVLADGINRGAGPMADPRFIAAFYGVSAVGGLGFAALSGGGGLTTLGTIGAESEISTGSTAVYQSVNAAGDVQYVGITNNFIRRAGEHVTRFAIDRIPGLSKLSRADAKAVEQVLIEHFQLGKNGGTLLNEINSIARSNPVYAQAIQRGIQILKTVGYPGF